MAQAAPQAPLRPASKPSPLRPLGLGHGCPPTWDISAEGRVGATAPLRLPEPCVAPQPCPHYGPDFGPPDKKRQASLRKGLAGHLYLGLDGERLPG